MTSSEATVLPVAAAETDTAPRQIGRNEKKYQKLLDDHLGPATGVIILVLCLFVYHFSLEDSEKIADHLAMNQAEQDMIIPPLASLMDKQGWDEATRNRILQSGDYIGLTLGAASYGSRVIGVLNELRGYANGNRGNVAQQAAPAGNAAGASNGHIQWGNELAGLSQYAA